VTNGQLILLLVATLLFAAGGGISLARLRGDRPGLRLAAKVCLYFGVCAAVGVLVWHSIYRGQWLPLEDNFDSLVWLGLLLTFFVLYVQRHRPLGGLDWFIMPIVILLFIGAAVLGRLKPEQYRVGLWYTVHTVSSFGGAIAFAIAAAVGTMYLISNRRLRKKSAVPGPNLGSLERLERLSLTAVTLGFALLSISLITGLVKLLHEGGKTRLGSNWIASPKIILALCVWVVYALVLHAPMNPSFRGRKAALLSIVGFLLMVGVLVAIQFMPGGKS